LKPRLWKEDSTFLLCNTNYDPERTEIAVRKVIENKVRGVAVMTSEFSHELARELARHEVAAVFYYDLGPVGRNASRIAVNYSEGVHQAIDHLYALGHREFAFIAGPQALRSPVIRRKAFIDALHQWGLPSDRTLEGNHKVEGGYLRHRDCELIPRFPQQFFAATISPLLER